MLAPQQQQLRRRVDAAVAEDTRVQAIDAAKKAAIRQRVDVETFQALVSAAHLRPMQGGLRIQPGNGGKPAAAPRHFLPDGSIAAPPTSSSVTPCCSLPSQTASDNALRSGTDFRRAWRAMPACHDRWQLLQQALQAGALPRLLKLEVNSQLLEDILDCLAPNTGAGQKEILSPQSSLPSDAASLAAAVLEAAAGASAFAVAFAGLPLQCRQRMASLVNGLEASRVASSALLQAYARHEEVAQGRGSQGV